MQGIIIQKTNEAFFKFITNDIHIFNGIRNHFTVFVENYRFMPLFKVGKWDGKICFIKENNVPIGLLQEVLFICSDRGYDVTFEGFETNENFINDNVLQKYCDKIKIKYPLYQHQKDIIIDGFNQQKILFQSKTGSGKSLALYVLCRIFIDLGLKILLLVPTIDLVGQMYDDFEEYGFTDIHKHTKMLFGEIKDKNFNKDIVISTWQSSNSILKGNGKGVFKGFDALLTDECHLARGNSLQKLAQACINAKYRIGVSGTLPERKRTVDYFGVVSNQGIIKIVNTYESLVKLNVISPIKINLIKIKYNSDLSETFFESTLGDYRREVDFISKFKKRQQLMKKLVNSLKGNTIVLFQFKRSHGDVLKELFIDRKYYYIDGDIPSDKRKEIIKKMEKEDNCLLISSFGTLSTGIDIKKIHNIVFYSNYRSYIKVLQSIGRGVRLHDSKSHVNIFDVHDIFEHNKRFNTSKKHFQEHKRMFKKEELQYKEITIDI